MHTHLPLGRIEIVESLQTAEGRGGWKSFTWIAIICPQWHLLRCLHPHLDFCLWSRKLSAVSSLSPPWGLVTLPDSLCCIHITVAWGRTLHCSLHWEILWGCLRPVCLPPPHPHFPCIGRSCWDIGDLAGSFGSIIVMEGGGVVLGPMTSCSYPTLESLSFSPEWAQVGVPSQWLSSISTFLLFFWTHGFLPLSLIKGIYVCMYVCIYFLVREAWLVLILYSFKFFCLMV